MSARRIRARRSSAGSTLAFLDIMSCGLGAVVLVFMLVKYRSNLATAVEAESLQDDIVALEVQRDELQATLQQLRQTHITDLENIRAIQAQSAALRKIIAEKQADSAEDQAALQKLKQDIATTKVKKGEDVIAMQGRGEEDYLMGLKVEGKRIAILFDSSASMAAEKLIDVIKIKNGNDADKAQAEKWLRAKRILHWLLARLPEGSQVVVVSFNDTARVLGSGSWETVAGTGSLQAILADIRELLPRGATNLQAGLKAVRAQQPSHLYVVTDGLPTVGDSRYAGLNPFSNCNSLLGRSNTISGECRVKLFRHTIKESGPGAIRINVILLPMEGDPDASNQYWTWAGPSGGLLLAPAPGWP